MLLASPRAAMRWSMLLCGAAGLVACSTPMPPAAPSTILAPAPVQAVDAAASAPMVVSDLPPGPLGAAVEARFPEPAVSFATPAFQFAHRGYTSNEELLSFTRGLARDAASTVRVVALSASQNGEPLEALVFSRNADANPVSLQRSGRPTVLLIGQQHGDEAASSEALLVVAQELARGALRTLLDRIHVVIVPRVNLDGAKSGSRLAANGIDIDRDHVWLKTPEAQALARLVRDYQPQVVVAAGEYEVSGRYQQKFGAVQRDDALLQYATTGNLPAFVTKASEEWFRQPLIASLKRQGFTTQWLNNTSSEIADKRITMGSTHADTGRNVQGLKNVVSFAIDTRGVGLGEMHFKRRVQTQVLALTSVLQSAANRGSDLLKLRQYVEAEVSAQTCQGLAVLDTGFTPTEFTMPMLDPLTGVDKELVVNWDSALVLREVKLRARPCGYWLAADQGDLVARLRLLGVRVDQATARGVVQGESFNVVEAQPGLSAAELKTTPALLDVPEGSFFVPMGQPLANLALVALEPDGPSSFYAGGIVTDLSKVARATALPATKLVPMP